MKKNKKVIVAGQICLDITPKFPQGDGKSEKNIPLPGRMIQVEGSDVHVGGAVSNTGIAMKMLGADVEVIGKIGDDDFGKIVMESLRGYGVERHVLTEKGGTTGHVIVLAPPGVDRSFILATGVNDALSAEDVREEYLEDVTLFHFGYPTVMREMYQNNGEGLIRLFRKVKERGIITSLDMSAVDPDSEAGSQDWKKILEEVLPFTDMFVPSVEELVYMLDASLYREWMQRAGKEDIVTVITWDEVRSLGRKCLQMGAKIVLIKCGAAGMYYATASPDNMTEVCEKLQLNPQDWGGKEGFEKSYIPDRVLSGTGAGDTSIAAFLTAMLEAENLDTALKLATGEGASCVAGYDALSGLLSIGELKRKIADGWKKQETGCI